MAKITNFTILNNNHDMNTTALITVLIGGLGLPELLVIALVVLLLFGGRKIPELMRGLGKGVRAFKDGLNDISDGNKDNKETAENKHNDTVQ